MRRIMLILAALCLMGGVAKSQTSSSYTYEPALDVPQHTLGTISITFNNYTSIRLTDPETALISVYSTALEAEKGEGNVAAMVYYAYANSMKVEGNRLEIKLHKYTSSTGSTGSIGRGIKRKEWGTGGEDFFRIAIPKDMITATTKFGTERSLAAITYKYEYTDEVDPNAPVEDPLTYVLTPADGEEVASLSIFSLEFPYCEGLFTLNYEQEQDPYVLDGEGNVVTTGTRSFDYSKEYTGTITLKKTVTEAGTYTLVIPEASYHMSTSVEEWDDSIRHPEIRATYKVLGSEARLWEVVPADQSTVTTFDGIHFTFPGHTITAKATNIGGGNLKVYEKGNDTYPAMEFSYYFAKFEEGTIHFTTASQVSKVKDGSTYYLDVPQGLLTFEDGSTNDAMHVEFTYDTHYTEGPVQVEGDNYIGYTTSVVTRKAGVRFNSGAEQALLICIPKEKTALLRGAKVKAIRTACGTSQTENNRLIIIEGDDLDATPAMEQAVGSFTTSMKDYALDTPYEITGDKPLYVGIRCSLAAEYKPMLFDNTQNLPAGLAWALTDEGWTDISAQGYGAPNLQLLVDRNVPEPDLLVKPLQTSAYNKVGDEMTIGAQIFNYGMEEVSSFDLTYQIGEAPAVTKHIEDITLSQGKTYDLIIDDANIDAAGRLALNLQVTNVNGKNDADITDNTQASCAYIYPAETVKKVLYEEFTGMACVNCPAGTATVNEVLRQYPGQYVEVYHHAGYEPDNFTTAEDVEYMWLYNQGGSTYAPGGTVNRRAATAGASSVVFQSNLKANVTAAMASAMELPPYVSINMDNTFNAITREGAITVDLLCHEVPSDAPHRLNVWIVQDNVYRYQKGTEPMMHNSAMRMSLTGTWGTEVALVEGEHTVVTLPYSIPETITGKYATHILSANTTTVDNPVIDAWPDFMRLVAFVSDATSNPLTCTVWNAEECNVTDGETTGVTTVNAETEGTNTYYDASGRRVSTLKHGVYISRGKKILK